MDSIDRNVLYELHWDARQSYSELAKKLRISKQVIRYRVERLQASGVIQGYHAVIDWRRLGYNALRIYIKWQNINLEEEKMVYETIRNDPLFMWCIRFEGEIDIAFYVWVKDILEFSQKWFEFLSKYKKYIRNYEVYESIEMINYPLKFLRQKSTFEELIIGKRKAISYDQTDYNILGMLTQNARISVIEISKRIKLTPKTAIYRLRKLETTGILLGYYALLNTDKLGMVFYKIDFYLSDLSQLKEMNQYAKQHPHVIYRMKTIGGPDFEIEVLVKDVSQMKSIINEIRERFPDIINRYRFHRFEYTIKQVYLPGSTEKRS